MRDLLASVRMCLANDGSSADSINVRAAYNAQVVSFRASLSSLAVSGSDSAGETFEDIRERLGEGAEDASGKATAVIEFVGFFSVCYRN